MEPDVVWNPALSRMLAFFEVLFANSLPLVVWLLRHRKKKFLVYTDAAYVFGKWSGLGVIILDTKSNKRWIVRGEVPRQNCELAALSKGEQWAINQLKLLALVTAVTTFPELFKDKDCLVCVENVSCLEAAVHGTAKNENMSEMANALHVSLARCALSQRCFLPRSRTGELG